MIGWPQTREDTYTADICGIKVEYRYRGLWNEPHEAPVILLIDARIVEPRQLLDNEETGRIEQEIGDEWCKDYANIAMGDEL